MRRIVELTDEEIWQFLNSVVEGIESVYGIKRSKGDDPTDDAIDCTVVTAIPCPADEDYPDGYCHPEDMVTLYGNGTMLWDAVSSKDYKLWQAFMAKHDMWEREGWMDEATRETLQKGVWEAQAWLNIAREEMARGAIHAAMWDQMYALKVVLDSVEKVIKEGM